MWEGSVFKTMETSQDLFQVDWTQGNLGSIPWVVTLLSTVACIVISVIGFGIVIFSICKNALAGLYAVSPKLWDRVDEIKKAGASAHKEGGNQLINILGSIPTIICKALPNIKALTEFEDEQMSPKVYFMKSLPLLCVEIFIGAFVFFGYPATFANKVQEFGTGVIDVVFANVDPLGWVEKLPGEIAIFPFVTKSSDVDFDKNIYKIAQEGAATLYTRHTDIKKNSKTEGALNFEQWAIQEFSGIGEYMDDREAWSMSVQTSYSTSMSASQERIDKGAGLTEKEDGESTYKAGAMCPVSSLNIGKDVPAEDNICVILVFTKNTVDVTGSKANVHKELTLHLDQTKFSESNGTYTSSGISFAGLSMKNGGASAKMGNTTIMMNIEGGDLKFSGGGNLNGKTITPGSAANFTYSDGKSTAKILTIVFDGNGSTYFTAGGEKFAIGDAIPKQNSATTQNNSGEEGEDSNEGGAETGTSPF